MDSLIDYCESMWIKWRDSPHKYENYLKTLGNEMKIDFFPYAPICFQGDFSQTEGKILMCFLNPGISMKNKKFNKWEEKTQNIKYSEIDRQGLLWLEQETFMIDFFKNLSLNKLNHSFFTKNGNVIARVLNSEQFERHSLYEFLNKNIINVDIIPYYSLKFALSKQTKFSAIRPYWDRLRKYIESSSFKAFILSGKQNYSLMVKNQMLKRVYQIVKINIRGRNANTKTEIELVKIGKKYGVLAPHTSIIVDRKPLIASLRKVIKMNEN